MFDDYFESLKAWVEIQLRRMGARACDVPDLTQQTIWAVYRKYHQDGGLKFDGRLKAIAKTTARHLLYRSWKNRKRERDTIEHYSLNRKRYEWMDHPEENREEFDHLIARFSERANPDTVSAVNLWYDGQSYQEISQTLDKPQPFARQAIFSFLRFVRRNHNGDSV